MMGIKSREQRRSRETEDQKQVRIGRQVSELQEVARKCVEAVEPRFGFYWNHDGSSRAMRYLSEHGKTCHSEMVESRRKAAHEVITFEAELEVQNQIVALKASAEKHWRDGRRLTRERELMVRHMARKRHALESAIGLPQFEDLPVNT
jgi:hypothetical protein